MRQRVRGLVAGVLPTVLLGVWATFLVLTGATAPPAPAAPAVPVAAAAASQPVRADAPTRPRETRQARQGEQAPVVREAEATDVTARPPVPTGALEGPAPYGDERPLVGGESVLPRQERAPPSHAYHPRHTRAPPSTRSS
ncbi:hypothetical protein ACH44C_12765 [Streptomyces purpureus]|uniref:hypothetical protein n=1 Tax=Streptomyces purpureus TaxID=1951 RepID=UPI0037B9F6CF